MVDPAQTKKNFDNLTDSNVESVLKQHLNSFTKLDTNLETEKNEKTKSKNEGKITEEELKSFNQTLRKQRVDLNIKFKNALRIFLQAYSEKTAITKPLEIKGISGDLRKVVHDTCDEFGLNHKTTGTKHKILHISKVQVAPIVTDTLEEKINKLISEVEEELGPEDMCPDPVEAVNVLELSDKFAKIDFQAPADNGFEILHYSVEVNGVEPFEHQGSPPIQLPYLKDEITEFSIVPVNAMGPALDNKTFRLKIKGFQKGKLFIAGDVSENQAPSVTFTKKDVKILQVEDRLVLSSFAELDFFSGWVKAVSSKENVLLVLDSGKLAQWGITLNSKDKNLEEIYPEKEEELLEQIASDPFFLLDHQTPKTKIFVNTVACGRDFGLLTTIQGQAYSWGKNFLGQLGLGDNNTRTFPVRIKGLLEKEFVTEVSAGEFHSLALSSKGSVYTWGYRQALVGEPIIDRFGKIVDFVNNGINLKEPRRISEVIGDCFITKITAGSSHNAAIGSNGELFTWGDNELGQLGMLLDNGAPSCMIPRRVEAFNNYTVLDVSCGSLHTLAIVVKKSAETKESSEMILEEEKQEKLNADRPKATELWSWGSGNYYQTGHNDKANRITPARINSKSLAGLELKSVSAGFSHSLALTVDGKLLAWGRNKFGPLGFPARLKTIREPALVDLQGLKPREALAMSEISALII